MRASWTIGTRTVGEGAPVFIIAEISANHLQKFDLAVETIKTIKKAGADAVKLQTYTPDTLTLDSENDCFRIKQGTQWDGKTLYRLYQEAYTPWEWQPKLMKVAEEVGLICFSSPFDKSSVDFLEEMKVPAYKIASFEITDLPLVAYVASKGKPVILSTGIATLSEMEEAVNTCQSVGNDRIALLRCVSAYPAPIEETNLKIIPDLQKRFNAVPGLSDHTMGISVPIAAVAVGAKIVEKHFILDRKLGGPDASFSLEPEEFAAMARGVREAEAALGSVQYELSAKVQKSRELARSLFVVEEIKAGERFTEENIRSIRPGFGLPPKYLKEILGRRSKCYIQKGTPLTWAHVEGKSNDD